MRTLDGRFTKHTSRWARLWRDLRLLGRIAAMATQYFVNGSRVRRAYRKKEARGDVYWIDDAAR